MIYIELDRPYNYIRRKEKMLHRQAFRKNLQKSQHQTQSIENNNKTLDDTTMKSQLYQMLRKRQSVRLKTSS